MTDKKLESFKIADTRKPSVSNPKKGPEKQVDNEDQIQSVGFARIEKILENNDAEALSEKLSELINSLEQFGGQATTNKGRAAAKKAIIAVERTADLLDYLFQTKAHMQTGG